MPFCYESKTILFVTRDCFLTFFQVRCWEVQDNGQTVPKAQQMHTGPVLDVCWSEVGPLTSHIFTNHMRCLNETLLIRSLALLGR